LLLAAELLSAYVLRVAAHVWPHAWLHVWMSDVLIEWLSSDNSALSPAPGSLLFYCSSQLH
jgi:hypothetical protein